MSIPKKIFTPKRKISFIIILLVLLAIYLNRSYAHIFDYDKIRPVVRADIQTHYTLKEGRGSDSIKYVALGDSLTYGFGALSYKETYSYSIASRLLDKHKEVEVVNLAVPGAVTEEVLEYQLPGVLEEKPNYVTLMIGTNDVHDFVKDEKFRGDLVTIIDSLKSIGAKVTVINIPYLGTTDLILPPHDLIMDFRIKHFNKTIQDVAEEESVRYIDLYSLSKEEFQKNPEKYYSYDKFHPSAEGYAFWGELINVD